MRGTRGKIQRNTEDTMLIQKVGKWKGQQKSEDRKRGRLRRTERERDERGERYERRR